MFYHVCECRSFKSQDMVDDVGTGALAFGIISAAVLIVAARRHTSHKPSRERETEGFVQLPLGLRAHYVIFPKN